MRLRPSPSTMTASPGCAEATKAPNNVTAQLCGTTPTLTACLGGLLTVENQGNCRSLGSKNIVKDDFGLDF